MRGPMWHRAPYVGAIWALSTFHVLAATSKLLDSPAPKDFLRRSGAKATVLGNYLYIDGGEVSQILDGNFPPGDRPSNAVNSTLSIDLTTSWSASTVTINTIAKSAPALTGQSIWNDPEGDGFYIYGGHSPYGYQLASIPKNAIWRFGADGKGGGAWSKETPSNVRIQGSFTLAEDTAYVTAGDTGFWLGGLASGWTENFRLQVQPVPGLLSFNMSTKAWQNDTSFVSLYGTLSAGAAIYVPEYGPNGLVMVMGGVTYSLLPDPKSADGEQDFGNLTLFDPVTKQWYWQKATGQVPPPRQDFCAVGIRSPSGTHEVFVFGGTDNINNRTFDDAYVLTLPGFAWKQIPATSGGGPRSNSNCVVVGKRQMLTIGGVNDHAGWPDLWSKADPFEQGLAILDMTSLTWGSNYDANAAPYESPQIIKDWYAAGNLATVSWSSSAVQQLFAQQNNKTGSLGATSSQTSSSSTPVGAIVGGVIGGIAVCAVIGLIAFFIIRQRKRRSREYNAVAIAEHTMDWKPQPPPHEDKFTSELTGSSPASAFPVSSPSAASELHSVPIHNVNAIPVELEASHVR